MKDLLWNIKFSNVSAALKDVTDSVQNYLNIVIGSIAGLMALAMIIIGIYYGVRIGTTADPQQRKTWLTALSWLGASFLIMIVLWAISSIIVSAIGGVFSN